jgi:UDP-N-acetyl-D-galactosamine dehydrogenase
MYMNINKNTRLGIIGLGYVGLPLAVEFGKVRNVKAFDIDVQRIEELRNGVDSTLEIDSADLAGLNELYFTGNIEDLRTCNCFIITVPTPIDDFKRPDLSYLIKASEAVASILKPQDIVIYESTVYPGCTEEICIPVLEKKSGLQYNLNLFAGYSPERINPGDKLHRLADIKKVTSGSTPEVAEIIDSLYREIIIAGTHKAKSIKVAEAAKVIENTQRDINIALINELAIIFQRMDVDTQAVLEAAGTKWNFLPFRPGLVGGHCIGVDPYYLTHKAQSIGYHPELILSGRRLNDSMGVYVASQLVKAMARNSVSLENARVLVMGLTFKENCPDTRNTRVVDIIRELRDYKCTVDVYDPWIQSSKNNSSSDYEIITSLERGVYDAIVLAVAHKQFAEMGIEAIRDLGKNNVIIYDLKYIFPASETQMRL